MSAEQSRARRTETPCIFPHIREMRSRDAFAADCQHSHPLRGFPALFRHSPSNREKRSLFALTLCEACRHSRHPRRICRRGQIEEIVVGAVVGSEADLEAAQRHARSLPKVDIGPSPRHAQAAVVVLTQPPTRPLTLASSEKLTLLPTKLKPLISAQVTSIVATVSKKVPPLNEPKR